MRSLLLQGCSPPGRAESGWGSASVNLLLNTFVQGTPYPAIGHGLAWVSFANLPSSSFMHTQEAPGASSIVILIDKISPNFSFLLLLLTSLGSITVPQLNWLHSSRRMLFQTAHFHPSFRPCPLLKQLKIFSTSAYATDLIWKMGICCTEKLVWW